MGGGDFHLPTLLLILLQAYSVYDKEVGYCQGSLFLAGVLLMHVSCHWCGTKKGLFWDFSLVLLPPSLPKMPEEETFCVFTHLMYHYRLRELYKPSMADLALFFYQLECLVEVSHVRCPRALHACRLSHWRQFGLTCGHIIVQGLTCSLFQLSSPHYLWP